MCFRPRIPAASIAIRIRTIDAGSGAEEDPAVTDHVPGLFEILPYCKILPDAETEVAWSRMLELKSVTWMYVYGFWALLLWRTTFQLVGIPFRSVANWTVETRFGVLFVKVSGPSVKLNATGVIELNASEIGSLVSVKEPEILSPT